MTTSAARVFNRIDQTIESKKPRRTLIVYLPIGYPDLESTIKLAYATAKAGVDILELGTPYSDPLADGPIIQSAYAHALSQGITVNDCLYVARQVATHTNVPVVLMTYSNIVVRRGIAAFAHQAADAGIQAVLMPDFQVQLGTLAQNDTERQTTSLDLPPITTRKPSAKAPGICFETVQSTFADVNLHLIPFCAPTTTLERMKLIARLASGFIYCVSTTGVTGPRAEFSSMAAPMISKLRSLTSVPIALGFGISTPEQARNASKLADAVIVGSAIVAMIPTHSMEDIAKQLSLFAAAVNSF